MDNPLYLSKAAVISSHTTVISSHKNVTSSHTTVIFSHFKQVFSLEKCGLKVLKVLKDLKRRSLRVQKLLMIFFEIDGNQARIPKTKPKAIPVSCNFTITSLQGMNF